MSKKSHFVLGFVLGAASSVAATYLLAPASVKRLKDRLADDAQEWSDRAADYYDYARDAASGLRSSAEELATGLKTKLGHDEKFDLGDYDAETEELRSAVMDHDDTDDSDDDFDDIVVDGKSAFAQAKDEATPTAEDVAPSDAEADNADEAANAAEPDSDADDDAEAANGEDAK